jgi:uncharacterized protein HemX
MKSTTERTLLGILLLVASGIGIGAHVVGNQQVATLQAKISQLEQKQKLVGGLVACPKELEPGQRQVLLDWLDMSRVVARATDTIKASQSAGKKNNEQLKQFTELRDAMAGRIVSVAAGVLPEILDECAPLNLQEVPNE